MQVPLKIKRQVTSSVDFSKDYPISIKATTDVPSAHFQRGDSYRLWLIAESVVARTPPWSGTEDVNTTLLWREVYKRGYTVHTFR